jgi:hypothetical protein
MAKKPTNTQRISALEAEVDALDERVDTIEDAIEPQNEIVTFVVNQIMAFDGNPETVGNEYYMPTGFDLAAHAAANGAQDGDYAPLDGDRFDCTLIVAEQMQADGLGYILEV